MRYSRLFGKTLRQPPHEVADPGHALLVQGGFIRSIGQGLYSFLPLGMRVIDKIESVIRDEMDRLGGQEVQVPLVNPYRLWWKGGRTDLIKRDLINFKDRSGLWNVTRVLSGARSPPCCWAARGAATKRARARTESRRIYRYSS